MVLVLMAYELMPLINAHADISKEARCLNFGLSFQLHPDFACAYSEGSDEAAHMGNLQ